MTALAWLRTHLGALATWPLARLDAWATGWIETIHEPEWIVEETVVEIALDSDDLWAELDAEEAWARLAKAINIPRPRREGEIG